MNPDMISITVERYNDLLRSEKILLALEAGGVDNWDYYSDALADAGVFDDDEQDEDWG